MSEIYLECQYNGNDKMAISNGEFICFEIFVGDESMTICIDDKQAYTVMKALESFRNERLD
jgi:hypothetical protein